MEEHLTSKNLNKVAIFDVLFIPPKIKLKKNVIIGNNLVNKYVGNCHQSCFFFHKVSKRATK